jgi:hypothetical protein
LSPTTPEAPASKSPGENQYEPGEFRIIAGLSINAGGGKDE